MKAIEENNNYLICNATLVNEATKKIVHILVQDGIIAEIFSNSTSIDAISRHADTILIDAKGKYVLPGCIDEHVHFREPGATHKADMLSESKAALAGGVTSVMDMPNVNPQTVTNQLLEDRFSMAKGRMFCNYSFYLAATDSNFAEVEKMDKKRVCGLKLFIGSSTGNMLISNEAVLDKIFQIKDFPIAVHAENEDIICKNSQYFKNKYGEDVPIEKHCEIRSEEACVTATKSVMERAEKYGTQLHIMHVTTQKEVELLRRAPHNIIGEVCTSYLCFDNRDYQQFGTKLKCNPAIKSEADKLALLKGLQEGVFATVGSDHAPHLLEEKQNTYFKAPSGIPIVQHTLLVLLDLVAQKKLTLEQLTAVYAHHPAQLYKIEKRGFVRKGYYADLVIVDMEQKTKVTKENIYYKCAWSIFEGREFHAKIEKTFVNGILAFNEGKFVSESPAMELQFER